MALPRHFFAPSFHKGRLGYYFAILVGIIVFLATFSLAAEATLSAMTLTWDHGMSERLTVEIPAVGDEATVPQSERVNQTLSILRAMAGIRKVTLLTDHDAEELLKPWITQPELLKALPIPTLIDIERQPDSLLSAVDVRQQLKNAVPDIEVDDHAVWISDLSYLVHGLVAIGGIMIVMTALTLILAVSLLCRAIMAAESETVALLHVLGAEDEVIARHFAYHAGRLSCFAAFIGFGLAASGAISLLYFMRHFLNPMSISLSFWIELGVSMCVVPLLAVMIAAGSARLATLHDLAELP